VTIFMQFFFRQHSHRNASLIVFLSSGVWGIMWYPMREAEALGLGPIWVQGLFMLMPALALLPFAFRATMAARHHWLIYLAAGGLINAGFTCFGLGLLLASVSKTTVLFYLTPVWGTILGRFFLGERPGWQRWLAVAAAVIGCGLVMRLDPWRLAFEPADLLGLFSGVLWGAGAVILRRFPDADFRNISLVQYIIGVVLAGLLILVLEVPVPAPAALVAAAPWAFIFGALLFLPSLLLIFRVSQYLSPGLVGILMLSEILVAATTAALFLGERLDAAQLFGVGLIVAAGAGVAFAGPQGHQDDRVTG
jgi:drug/metabolite transporter (DMT)-like permease|tara:strand:- start:2692 stop:3612 length:921 start_codon:yes stop_codon:yes gene_type:complete